MSELYLTIERLSIKDITRIFSKIQVDPETECWNWIRALDTSGYGKMGYKGRAERVHRLMYAWLVGPLPKGVSKTTPQVDHLCRNRICCNPAHLELVLPKTNSHRGVSFSAENAVKTHCPQGHEYNEENTYHHGQKVPGRHCKECILASHRAAYAKRKEDPEYMAQKRANAMNYYFKYAANPEWRARRAKYESERQKKKNS